MALTKQYAVDLDIASGKQGVGGIDFVLPDENVYTVVATVKSGDTLVDLTPYTVEMLLNNTPLTGVSVTDAANGVVTITFSDLSGYEGNSVYKTILKLTEGTVVRHYNGFNFSTRTLP